MGKEYFKNSCISPIHYLDHSEMANWNTFSSAQELNCSSEKQSMECFTNPKFNYLTSQSNHFDSSFSSIASSPAPNDSFLFHKLIENSETLSQIVNNDLPNNQNSEPVTPLFHSLVADQGFIERAAKFSFFLRKNSLPCSNGKNSVSRENSSVPEIVKSGGKGSKSPGELNSRKRKTVSQGNSKEDMVEKADEIDNAKRSKANEENGGKKVKETKSGDDTSGEDASEKQEKGKQNPAEAPKDYIHVRARRGQATDSHSLAERVRREKISERMKLLEDLVPGCNKVTGKALMLDEIINYVQALQHQVEFLSMKLASVNTEMNSVGDNLVPKPLFQPNALYSSHQSPQQLQNYASGVSASIFPMNPLDRSTGLGMSLPPPNRFGEGPPQISVPCEGGLESIVQMAISDDGQTTFNSLGFSAQKQVSIMKIEL